MSITPFKLIETAKFCSGVHQGLRIISKSWWIYQTSNRNLQPFPKPPWWLIRHWLSLDLQNYQFLHSDSKLGFTKFQILSDMRAKPYFWKSIYNTCRELFNQADTCILQKHKNFSRLIFVWIMYSWHKKCCNM